MWSLWFYTKCMYCIVLEGIEWWTKWSCGDPGWCPGVKAAEQARYFEKVTSCGVRKWVQRAKALMEVIVLSEGRIVWEKGECRWEIVMTPPCVNPWRTSATSETQLKFSAVTGIYGEQESDTSFMRIHLESSQSWACWAAILQDWTWCERFSVQ